MSLVIVSWLLRENWISLPMEIVIGKLAGISSLYLFFKKETPEGCGKTKCAPFSFHFWPVLLPDTVDRLIDIWLNIQLQCWRRWCESPLCVSSLPLCLFIFVSLLVHWFAHKQPIGIIICLDGRRIHHVELAENPLTLDLKVNKNFISACSFNRVESKRPKRRLSAKDQGNCVC